MTNSDNLLHLVSTGQHLVFEKHLPLVSFLHQHFSFYHRSSPVECKAASRRPNPTTPMRMQRNFNENCAYGSNVIIVNKKNPKYKI